jgi:hypothetical protein
MSTELQGLFYLILFTLVFVFLVLPTIPLALAYKNYRKKAKPPKDDVERAARMYAGHPEFDAPFIAYCIIQYGSIWLIFCLWAISFHL